MSGQAEQLVQTFVTNFNYLNARNERASFADKPFVPSIFHRVERVFLDCQMTAQIEDIALRLRRVLMDQDNLCMLWANLYGDDKKIEEFLHLLSTAYGEVRTIKANKQISKNNEEHSSSRGKFEQCLMEALEAMLKMASANSSLSVQITGFKSQVQLNTVKPFGEYTLSGFLGSKYIYLPKSQLQNRK